MTDCYQPVTIDTSTASTISLIGATKPRMKKKTGLAV